MASKSKQKFYREQYKKVASRSKPGTGARFKALAKSIAARPGVRNPKAVAASIGREKYGTKRMAGWSAAGRKRA